MINIKLQIKNDNANVKEISLTEKSTIIGRGAECGLRISSSDVSRKHCRIELEEKKVTITDLGSSNGTFVNQQKIAPNFPKTLLADSIIKIGPLEVIVKISKDQPQKEPQKEPAKPAPVKTPPAKSVPLKSETVKQTKPDNVDHAKINTSLKLTDTNETIAVDSLSSSRAAKKKASVEDTIPMTPSMKDLFAEALEYEYEEETEDPPSQRQPVDTKSKQQAKSGTSKNTSDQSKTIKLDIMNDEIVKDSGPDLDIIIDTEGSDIILLEEPGAALSEDADQEIADFLKNLKDED